MHRYLSLDIGTRRTGVAIADSETGIALPRETIKHQTMDELLDAVLEIYSQEKIDTVVIGLPLLPSGEAGEQASVSRRIAERLQAAGISIAFIDERYTSPVATTTNEIRDQDAESASHILSVFLDRKKAK